MCQLTSIAGARCGVREGWAESMVSSAAAGQVSSSTLLVMYRVHARPMSLAYFLLQVCSAVTGLSSFILFLRLRLDQRETVK